MGLMPTHLKKGLENGGDITQSELQGVAGSAVGREMPAEGVQGGKGRPVVNWWYGWGFVM
jgi:hypothetical protein